MAILHVDLYSGNDANDGSSWALAKKTLVAGLAALNDSDELRISKTPVPALIGNASWTQFTTTIVTENQLTQSIETCVGNTWTSVAGVTRGTSNNRKYGATAQTFIITNTATGKLAYKALPSSLNLSGFSHLSFIVALVSGTVANFANSGLSIALCSDATGDNIIDSFPIDAILSTFTLYPMVIAKGGAMGSAINSIALYRTTAVAASITISLNNVIAANSTLNHLTIVGRSQNIGTRRYAIRNIINNTIEVDSNTIRNTEDSGGYCESTESLIPLYGFNAVIASTSASTTVIHTLTKSNCSLKFGYNVLTDEQDGETWFDGQNAYGIFFKLATAYNTIINRLCGCRYNYFYLEQNTRSGSYLYECVIISNSIGLYVDSATRLNSIISLNNLVVNIQLQGSNNYAENIISENAGRYLSGSNSSYGLSINGNNNIIDGIVIGVITTLYTHSFNVTGVNCTLKNLVDNIRSTCNLLGSANSLINCVINNLWLGADNIIKNTIVTNYTNNASSYFFNHNQISENNFIFNYDGNTGMQYLNDVAFGSTLGIWEIVLGRLLFSNISVPGGIEYTKRQLFYFKIAEIGVEAGVQTSISLWVKRAAISGRPLPMEGNGAGTKGSALVIRNIKSSAVDVDYTVEFPDGLFNWTMYGIVFTPDRTGVVALEINAFWDAKQVIQFSTINVAT